MIHLRLTASKAASTPPRNIAKGDPRHTLEVGAAVTLAELADEHIRQVLANTARLEDAAETLGIALATLHRRRRKRQAEASNRCEET